MKAFALPWVVHSQGKDEAGIHSIDFASCGLRFATGGQDHKVKIWSFASALVGDDESRAQAPTLLCTLSRHSSAVQTVRFSLSGEFLASGGADKQVLVYSLHPGEGSTTLGGKEKNIENWRVHRMFPQGLDVSEVAWGPESKKNLLATASYDGSVNVYDVEGNRALLSLRGHKNLIKGLCWDPLGEFIASQAEGEGIIVWNASSGERVAKLVKNLTHNLKAFEQSRLDWGPTGRCIAGTVGYNAPCFVAPLFGRDKWTSDCALIGHQNLVTVARYNPKLFLQPAEGGKSPSVSECIALGSGDSTFTVWLCHEFSPIFRGVKFTTSAISDMTWSRDGYTLLVSSIDGKVFGVNFKESELGEAVSDEEMEKILYGATGSVKSSDKKLPVPETFEQLRLEKTKRAATPSSPPRIPVGVAQPSTAAKKLLDRMRFTSHDNEQNDGGEKSEKMDSAARKATAGGGGGVAGPAVVESPRAGAKAGDASSNEPASAEQTNVQQKANDENGVGPSVGAKRDASAQDSEAPQNASTKESSRKRLKVEKRIQPTALSPEGVALPRNPSRPTTSKDVPEKRKAPDRSKPKSEGIQKAFSFRLGAANDQGDASGEVAMRLEALNEGSRARLVCKRGTQQVWSSMVKGTVVKLGGNLNFSAVATKEGFLRVFDAVGRQLLSLIKWKSSALFLETDNDFRLLAVLSDGHLHMYDIRRMTSILKTSTEHLGGASQVASVSISASGRPVVYLKNRDTYVYTPEMEEWVLVADSSRPYPGFLWRMAKDNCGEVGKLQLRTGEGSNPPPISPHPVQCLEFLEANMCAARSLDAPSEFMHWLTVYIRNLVSVVGTPQASGNEEQKLRKVCMDLLGLGDGIASDLEWAVGKATIDCRKWVEQEVIYEIGRNRELQRLREELEGLLECDDVDDSLI
ncbi:hypothetical protein BSKO_12857 [Bryopsis sp. KO-2023]|nr:hypothetical protein BSKO_12857 [Bryopsis sp. KO-2023]